MIRSPIAGASIALVVSMVGLGLIEVGVRLAGSGMAGRALAACMATAWLALCAPYVERAAGGRHG
jgi:hypothetical protein